MTGTDQYEKEEIAKLLRYECSSLPAGETISIPENVNKMKAGRGDIYYLCAPTRQLAETSPYFESEAEVLFCYDSNDERSVGEEVVDSEDSFKPSEQSD